MKKFKKLNVTEFRELIHNGTTADYEKYKVELKAFTEALEEENHKARYNAMVELDAISNTIPQFVETFKSIKLKADNDYTKKTKPIMDDFLALMKTQYPTVKIWIDKAVFSVYVEFRVDYRIKRQDGDTNRDTVERKLYVCQLEDLKRDCTEYSTFNTGSFAQYKAKIKKLRDKELELENLETEISRLKWDLNL